MSSTILLPDKFSVFQFSLLTADVSFYLLKLLLHVILKGFIGLKIAKLAGFGKFEDF